MWTAGSLWGLEALCLIGCLGLGRRVRCWSRWRWVWAVVDGSACGVRSVGDRMLAARLGSVGGFGLGLRVICWARRWWVWALVVGGTLWSTVVHCWSRWRWVWGVCGRIWLVALSSCVWSAAGFRGGGCGLWRAVALAGCGSLVSRGASEASGLTGGFGLGYRVCCWSWRRWVWPVVDCSACGVWSMGGWVFVVWLGSAGGFGLGYRASYWSWRRWVWAVADGGACWLCSPGPWSGLKAPCGAVSVVAPCWVWVGVWAVLLGVVGGRAGVGSVGRGPGWPMGGTGLRPGSGRWGWA